MRNLLLAAALSVSVIACSGTSDVTSTAPAATSSSPAQRPVATFALPHLGARHFPERIYPKAGPGGGGSIPGCPSAKDLQPFNGTAPARAVVIWATMLTRTFSYDLSHSDRAWWSTIRRDWLNAQQHGRTVPGGAAGPDAILYAGPLRTTPQFGVPRQYGFLKHWCGAALADRSYAIVSGPRRAGALQGVSVFLNRHNHVLLYYEYP